MEKWFEYFSGSGAQKDALIQATSSQLTAPAYLQPTNPLHADTFDYEFLLQGVGILCGADHFLVLIRTIRFLFFYLPFFPPHYYGIITHQMLLHRYFFSLFLHWNTAVRQAFHRLVLCKICPNISNAGNMLYELLSPPNAAEDIETHVNPVYDTITVYRRDLQHVYTLTALVRYLRMCSHHLTSSSSLPVCHITSMDPSLTVRVAIVDDL